MTDTFFSAPILNSPYKYPGKHWELDERGQPTGQVVEGRRKASFVTPIPKPKKQGKAQLGMALDEGKGLSTAEQAFDLHSRINDLRRLVDRWRAIPDPANWNVTPVTARLLQHWRSHEFGDFRPFFCQIEAAETAIWLTEVAPHMGKDGAGFLEYLRNASEENNPGLLRVALKLATGAGKTTVMAMLIAWQTINAVRHPGSKRFTRGFLVVTPGITIRDRLQVLLPNDTNAYYDSRELVPKDLLGDLGKAKIVITNFHNFKLRETLPLARGTRNLLQGHGPALRTLESEGQMIHRVMPDLMGLKNIWVMNDEAHHCYRERTVDLAAEGLKGDERKEAEDNKETARVWISGLEAVQRKLGVSQVVDLSATPFYLSGSGYPEGTLFPWTASDFSLMDAIECGIVKLPRVPVADNIPEAEAPIFRELWKHIGKSMPKKARADGTDLDPESLPTTLKSALDALHGHYSETFDLWQKAGIKVPPCFIVVCNNTATSKLVYEYIAGYVKENADGSSVNIRGKLERFSNYDENHNPVHPFRTLLIDSTQLESGDALDDNFRKLAGPEIEEYRRELTARTGQQADVSAFTDQQLLREVMNTVGKPGKLGEQVRCVVSVSMLTEGWDASTVTHVLGVRAFGTQLLCEQVIGRALRRQSYDLNPTTGLYDVEYADVLGIPFDFTAKPVQAPPQPPREITTVKAMPDREALEIRFPRVEGYRIELPEERLQATFGPDSTMTITPDQVGPTSTLNQGIIGEGVNLSMEHLKDERQSTILFHLTRYLMMTRWRDPNEEPRLHLFGQLKGIARIWLENHLKCVGDTYPAQVLYQELLEEACNRIHTGIVTHYVGERPIVPLLDPYNPTGSTRHVRFTTSKQLRWQTDSRKCHLNWVICDSNWEAEFCRAVEQHPRVHSYVKNHNLGYEVPYRVGSTARRYRPDFIVRVDDGRGADNLLNLVVEIKGIRDEESKVKASALSRYWVPAVNHHGGYGRWAAAEFSSVYAIEAEFTATIKAEVAKLITDAVESAARLEN